MSETGLVAEAMEIADIRLREGGLDHVAELKVPEELRPLVERAVMDMIAVVYIAQSMIEGSTVVPITSPVDDSILHGYYIVYDGEKIMGIQIAWQGDFLWEALEIDGHLQRTSVLFGDDQYLMRTPLKTQHPIARRAYLEAVALEIAVVGMQKVTKMVFSELEE